MTITTSQFLREIHLSPRACKVIQALNVKTWEDLAKCTPVDLLRIRYCGRQTVQELSEALAEKGLRLRFQGFWLKTDPFPAMK